MIARCASRMLDKNVVGVIFLHSGCNMRCGFCITEDTCGAMDFDQALGVFEILTARGIGNVVLGGGEPTLWPHGLFRLAAEAHSRGFLVQVGTNGIALPPDFSTRPGVDRYVLPLESARAAIHDAMRPGGNTSHHAVMLDRLEELGQAGREVTLSTVVSAWNAGELPALADWLTRYVELGGRLHAWHLYRFVPEGRGGGVNAHSMQVSLPDYDDACAAVRSMALPFPVLKRPDMRHSTHVDFFWYEEGRLRIGSETWGVAAGH